MTNQNQNNAAQAANEEIREAFELTYAVDADDPASATELSHFTNGWRACIMSQVGKPVVMKLAVDATAAIDLINATRRGLRAPVADERGEWQAFRDWAWKKEGPAVGLMVGQEAVWAGWQARAALASAPVADTYVEARECTACGHVGINDSSDTLAACTQCDWSGDSPVEDHCPGCDRDGTMTAACPKCGGRYSLLADRTITAGPVASAPVAGEPAYYAVMHGQALYGIFDSEAAAEECKEQGHPDAPFSVKPLYAVPQASAEDVAALVAFIFERFGRPGDAGELPDSVAAAVRRLEATVQPGAPKDGGQQRAAFDHPVFAFLLGEGQLHGVDFGERAPGAVGKWWWRKDLRAALSATQPEQGERDA